MESLGVLEIGCGKGDISIPLASLGCKVTAFDIDPDPVNELEKTAKRVKLDNVTAFVGDATSFPTDVKYDIVVVSEVIAYVGDCKKLLTNISTITKPDSYIVVTQPNGYGPYEFQNRARNFSWLSRVLKRLLGKRIFKGSYRWYTKRQLEAIFSDYSMRLTCSGKSDYLSSFLVGPLKNSSILAKLDCSIADILPFWAVSGWYLLFKKAPSREADQ